MNSLHASDAQVIGYTVASESILSEKAQKQHAIQQQQKNKK